MRRAGVLRIARKDRLASCLWVAKSFTRQLPGYILLIALLMPLNGCLGWLDVFEEKRPIGGHFFLQQGEDSQEENLYLFRDGNSGSIAGPIHKIGWDDKYILYTDANRPQPWTVIRKANGIPFAISDSERSANPDFKSIPVLSPSGAWLKARR